MPKEQPNSRRVTELARKKCTNKFSNKTDQHYVFLMIKLFCFMFMMLNKISQRIMHRPHWARAPVAEQHGVLARTSQAEHRPKDASSEMNGSSASASAYMLGLLSAKSPRW